MHTFEIDSTYTSHGQPTSTERRLVDPDHHLEEIFSSSRDSGSGIEVLDGHTAYIQATGMTCDGIDVKGNKWEQEANAPLSGAGSRWTDPFDYPLTAVSPAKTLTELSPIVTAIHRVGSETVNGVNTTKFDLVVSSSQMEAFMSAGLSSGNSTIRFAVAMWVDAGNRLRQSQITVMAPGQSNETVTNRYNHFGTPLHITIPPPSEIVHNCR